MTVTVSKSLLECSSASAAHVMIVILDLQNMKLRDYRRNIPLTDADYMEIERQGVISADVSYHMCAVIFWIKDFHVGFNEALVGSFYWNDTSCRLQSKMTLEVTWPQTVVYHMCGRLYWPPALCSDGRWLEAIHNKVNHQTLIGLGVGTIFHTHGKTFWGQVLRWCHQLTSSVILKVETQGNQWFLYLKS